MAKDSNTQTNTQTLATTQQGGALAVAQELFQSSGLIRSSRSHRSYGR